MQLFTIKLPAIESLPPEQREEILRRCMESPELRRLRARWRYARYLPFVLVPIAPVIALSTLSATATAAVLVAAVAGAFLAIEVLRVRAEVRLIRRLVRKELHDPIC
jgi:hypothetical protein